MRRLLTLGLISGTLGALACDDASETTAGPGTGSGAGATSASTAQSTGGSAGQSSGGAGGAAGSPGCGLPERPGTSNETIDVDGTPRANTSSSNQYGAGLGVFVVGVAERDVGSAVSWSSRRCDPRTRGTIRLTPCKLFHGGVAHYAAAAR